MSLIEEGYPQQVRMANLACIGNDPFLRAMTFTTEPIV